MTAEVTPPPPDEVAIAETPTAQNTQRATSGVSLRENPVLRRELLERVRGFKVVVFITLWLLILTGILVLAFQGNRTLNIEQGLDIASLGRVGREIYEWVLFGMLVLVLFLVPGLTAGAITGERERMTLVPLQMTMMRPIDIIVGKLAAALAFLVLLTVAAMPLLGTSLLVGGVTLVDVAKGISMLLFTGLVLGSVGIMFSAKFRRTTASTVMTYAVALVFSLGSFIGLAVWAVVDASSGRDEVTVPAELLAVNPFAALGDALPRTQGGFASSDTLTPFGGLRTLIDQLDDGQDRFDEFGFREPDRGPRIWIYYLAIGSIILAFSLRSSAKAIRTPAETER